MQWGWFPSKSISKCLSYCSPKMPWVLYGDCIYLPFQIPILVGCVPLSYLYSLLVNKVRQLAFRENKHFYRVPDVESFSGFMNSIKDNHPGTWRNLQEYKWCKIGNVKYRLLWWVMIFWKTCACCVVIVNFLGATDTG